MEIKINNLKIEISQRGIVTLKEKNNEIFLGSCKGNRFETLLQALKTAKEIGYLSDLQEEYESTVPTGKLEGEK